MFDEVLVERTIHPVETVSVTPVAEDLPNEPRFKDIQMRLHRERDSLLY